MQLEANLTLSNRHLRRTGKPQDKSANHILRDEPRKEKDSSIVAHRLEHRDCYDHTLTEEPVQEMGPAQRRPDKPRSCQALNPASQMGRAKTSRYGHARNVTVAAAQTLEREFRGARNTDSTGAVRPRLRRRSRPERWRAAPVVGSMCGSSAQACAC